MMIMIISIITAGKKKEKKSVKQLGPFSLIIILPSVPGHHLLPSLGGRLLIVSAEN